MTKEEIIDEDFLEYRIRVSMLGVLKLREGNISAEEMEALSKMFDCYLIARDYDL